jgi:UPF0271 protein
MAWYHAGVKSFELLGDRAIRFARPPGVSPRAIVFAVKAWPGVVDVVVARGDVGVYFDDTPAVDEAALAALAAVRDDAHPLVRDVVLRARYDGPDLEHVAREAQLSIEDVIELHAGGHYTVETIGFAPGFAYLTGLDPRLALPRRATPRPRVPAGSLGLAGGYTGVYPFASPGGWHLIGTVDEPMFGPAGARLAHGDRVRFQR